MKKTKLVITKNSLGKATSIKYAGQTKSASKKMSAAYKQSIKSVEKNYTSYSTFDKAVMEKQFRV